MMLPPFSDAREFLLPTALSYSELSTLSACEKKWSLVYDTPDRERYEATDPMKLGTHMHNLLNTWWGHGPDPAEWFDPMPDINATDAETAVWLMDRYEEVYGNTKLKMLQVTVPFAVKAFGVWLFGWFDGILEDEQGDLWIYEAKTMGNWNRLNQLPMDKQISLYIYAARRSGINVKGVMFDAILTTHWKTEEGEVYKSGPRKGEPKEYHPPQDSFRTEWVERTDDQIEEFKGELWSALARRSDIAQRIHDPVRNIGQACDWCPVMAQCYGITLELVDSDPFA